MARLEHVLSVGVALREADVAPEATDAFLSSMKNKLQSAFEEGNVKLGKAFVKHVWWNLWYEYKGEPENAKKQTFEMRKVWLEMVDVLEKKAYKDDILIPTYGESVFLARYLLLASAYPPKRSEQNPKELARLGEEFWNTTKWNPDSVVLGRAVVVVYWLWYKATQEKAYGSVTFFEARLKTIHELARKTLKKTHEPFTLEDMLWRANRVVVEKPKERNTPLKLDNSYPLILYEARFGGDFFDFFKLEKESLLDKARSLLTF